jgi:hypothetical protein
MSSDDLELWEYATEETNRNMYKENKKNSLSLANLGTK